MVINIAALKDKEDDVVEADIRGVVEAAAGKALVKVIIETCLLTDEEKERACRLAVSAGADFVKTSTGFSTGGATKEDIALMRKTVGPDIGVKASGGVRTKEDVDTMVEAGASRIGCQRRRFYRKRRKCIRRRQLLRADGRQTAFRFLRKQ